MGGRAGAAQGKSQAQVTVERRLYDIGSILTSLGLIEKMYMGKRCVGKWGKCRRGESAWGWGEM